MQAARPLANPYFLLTMTTLFWSGNTIAGRLAVGQISPMTITFIRWTAAFALMAVFFPQEVRKVPGILRERPAYVAVMAIIGFTGCNAIFYVSAHYTYAVNLGIMQASTPIFVMLGAAVYQRLAISAGQIVGLAVGVAGVLLVASAGSLSTLKSLNFNRGDVMVLLVSALYAAYSLGLRDRTADWSAISFFVSMVLIAAITALPLLLIEIAMGQASWPSAKGWVIVSYVVIFPSLVAQIWFIKGVALVGAARAGFLFNAIPVFAAILAVAILGEPFGWYHAVGLALVLGGIAWAERHPP